MSKIVKGHLNFKLRDSPFDTSEKYQPAYGNVPATFLLLMPRAHRSTTRKVSIVISSDESGIAVIGGQVTTARREGRGRNVTLAYFVFQNLLQTSRITGVLETAQIFIVVLPKIFLLLAVVLNLLVTIRLRIIVIEQLCRSRDLFLDTIRDWSV
ncbi:hypothetical protein B0H14DRAFT_3424751 [Mycena olivaceomarginata]|nr:hypothetical protein B0H14DRAFT_3424751 [Mycena olivaceomarginata]